MSLIPDIILGGKKQNSFSFWIKTTPRKQKANEWKQLQEMAFHDSRFIFC
jgi:hypothetical protein